MEARLSALGGKLTRDELALVPTPEATSSHKPIPHIEVVNALIEVLGFRNIGIHKEEYCMASNGMRFFGIMELTQTFTGCRFALGIRNSNDKSLALAITVGYRVNVCDNLMFAGDFTPVMRKHTKNANLLESLTLGVDQMQRNFKPMVEAVEFWRQSQITDVQAKMLIYEAFIEGKLEAPKHLAPDVHRIYFNPTVEEFAPRTMWSLSNSFTLAFKQLDPVPCYKATGRLAEFLKLKEGNR